MKRTMCFGLALSGLALLVWADSAQAQRRGSGWGVGPGGVGYQTGSGFYAGSGGVGWGPGYYGGGMNNYRGMGNYYGGYGYSPYASGYGYQPYSGYGYQPSYSGYGYQPSYSGYGYGNMPGYQYSTPGYAYSNQQYGGVMPAYGYSGGQGMVNQAGHESMGGAMGGNTIRLHVVVPRPDARVFVDGNQTRQMGMERVFESPPVEPGKQYTYKLRVTWMENGQEVSREKEVEVTPGQMNTVRFEGDDRQGNREMDRTAPGTERRDDTRRDDERRRDEVPPAQPNPGNDPNNNPNRPDRPEGA